jgi:hypothetical protein
LYKQPWQRNKQEQSGPWRRIIFATLSRRFESKI